MVYIIYFASRKHFLDQSTWSKEEMPANATHREIEQAARMAHQEGYGILDTNAPKGHQIEFLKWFV